MQLKVGISNLDDLQDLLVLLFGCNILLHLVPNFQCFLGKFSKFYEPICYEDADRDRAWVAAMNEELAALQTNNTWENEDLPPGKKTAVFKWV